MKLFTVLVGFLCDFYIFFTSRIKNHPPLQKLYPIPESWKNLFLFLIISLWAYFAEVQKGFPVSAK